MCSSAYAYDALCQLIEEPGHTYTFDGLYNRICKDNEAYYIEDTYLLKQQGEISYTNDPNGNRVSQQTRDKEITYIYDAWDRLQTITYGDIQYRYVYDALDRRLSKSTWHRVEEGWREGNTQYFVYQEQNEITAYEGATRTVLRVLLPQSEGEAGATIAVEVGNAYFAIIQDIQGSIAALIDANTGNLVERYAYSAFGEQDASVKTLEISPWRHSGKRWDAESGFLYFGKRYYDPVTGRWTTPDPAWFEDGPNRYAYVHNNPFIHYDPEGLFSWDTCWGFGMGLGQGFWNCMSMDLQTTSLGQFDNISGDGNLIVGNRVVLQNDFSQGHFYGERAGEALGVLSQATLVGRALRPVCAGIRGLSTVQRMYRIANTEVPGTSQNIQQLARSFFATEHQTAQALSNPGKDVAFRFPKNPNDLLPELPRDRKGCIYPATNIRIRPEKHAFEGLLFQRFLEGQPYPGTQFLCF